MLDKLVSGIFGGGGGGGNFLANLAGNAITSKILGGDTKDALMFTALQQGLASQGMNLFGGQGAADKRESPRRSAPEVVGDAISNRMGSDAAASRPNLAQVATKASDLPPVFKQGEGTLGYAKFLVDSGLLNEESKLAGLLNSRVGEALATSLASGLASKLFDEEDPQSAIASRPFGGEGSIRLNIPQKMEDGGYINGDYFPRRNGGIMPSEGSGQKDDVPAMLMAGEFVLTKDAVKGLGNGDSQRGIEKAYSMMNQLENKANNYG